MIRAVLLAVVLGAVWFLWKTISEQKASAEAEEKAAADPATPTREEIAETAECPVCRAYVPVSAEAGCGREDCPIPELAAAMAEAGNAEVGDAEAEGGEAEGGKGEGGGGGEGDEAEKPPRP
ncbi:MAG: hypothetical protein IT556_15455 [Acetobacteraceae bacterium]|nr:hypothetical protein [Acetobacteraceae bacterium]